jgi:hypothetical protein
MKDNNNSNSIEYHLKASLLKSIEEDLQLYLFINQNSMN